MFWLQENIRVRTDNSFLYHIFQTTLPCKHKAQIYFDQFNRNNSLWCMFVCILFSRLTVFSFRYVIFSSKIFNKKETQMKTWKRRDCQKQTFFQERNLHSTTFEHCCMWKKHGKRTIVIMEIAVAFCLESNGFE